MKKGETRAQANRRIRQEAHRDFLSKKCTIEQVLERIRKIEDFDKELDTVQVNRIRIGIESRLKLINKYLPDTKSIEVVDEDGNDALPKSIVINVRSSDINTGEA